MEIVESDLSSIASNTSENCNLVNLLTQMRAKIEENRPLTNSPRAFDPSKVCAGDGSYYISQILKKLVGEEELCVDEPSSSVLSPRKMNEERFDIF